MSSNDEDVPKYAYLRILNDNWPAVMRALGVDNHSKRGLRVQGGYTHRIIHPFKQILEILNPKKS